MKTSERKMVSMTSDLTFITNEEDKNLFETTGYKQSITRIKKRWKGNLYWNKKIWILDFEMNKLVRT